MNNITIIYYTSNQEDPEFEKKIRDNILKAELPIISVSQKPIDLGKNICVGEKPVCYSNSYKQLLIGLKEAKTEFCIAAEADVLYPPEYFKFTPPTDEVYRYDNVWIYFEGRDKFYKKGCSEGAQMCDRKVWIESIEKVVGNGWKPEKFRFVFPKKTKTWSGRNPTISFRTRRGIGFKTGFQKKSAKELYYWGTCKEVIKKYL